MSGPGPSPISPGPALLGAAGLHVGVGGTPKSEGQTGRHHGDIEASPNRLGPTVTRVARPESDGRPSWTLRIPLCAHWCTHFSARRRRHISKTHFCQGGYVNEDAKTHFEDTLNEDEFPPEDELPREDTFRRHIKRRRISPRRRITSRRQISKTH